MSLKPFGPTGSGHIMFCRVYNLKFLSCNPLDPDGLAQEALLVLFNHPTMLKGKKRASLFLTIREMLQHK